MHLAWSELSGWQLGSIFPYSWKFHWQNELQQGWGESLVAVLAVNRELVCASCT